MTISKEPNLGLKLLLLRQPLCWPHPQLQGGLTSLCSSKRQTFPGSPIAIAAATLGGEGVVGDKEAKENYTLKRREGDGAKGPVCLCTLQAWGQSL